MKGEQKKKNDDEDKNNKNKGNEVIKVNEGV